MQREMHAEFAEYALNILALKSIDPNSKRFGIYPVSFGFPQKESSIIKRGYSNMLPIALYGPRPHLSEANAPHRCYGVPPKCIEV